MNALTFVKLGGSIITDKTRAATVDPAAIQRFAHEIAQSLSVSSDLRLVVGHGSGSFGHSVGDRYQAHLGPKAETGWEGYVQTAAAAARLNRLVTDIFLEARLPVVSLQPSASSWCRNGELLSLEVRPLHRLLSAGLIPLLYGDVALDEMRGYTIISTEAIFAYLARHLAPSRIILVGRVDGVFTADPLRDPHAELIPKITPSNVETVERRLGASHGVDVTGGMLSKVQTMYRLALAHPDLRVHIISGRRPGLLQEVLLHPDHPGGTVIHA